VSPVRGSGAERTIFSGPRGRRAGDSPLFLTEIDQALDYDDWPTVRRLAHTLKTTADNVGANVARLAALRLEQLAVERKPLEAREAFAEVDFTVRQLLPALSQFVSEIAGGG